MQGCATKLVEGMSLPGEVQSLSFTPATSAGPHLLCAMDNYAQVGPGANGAGLRLQAVHACARTWGLVGAAGCPCLRRLALILSRAQQQVHLVCTRPTIAHTTSLSAFFKCA